MKSEIQNITSGQTNRKPSFTSRTRAMNRPLGSLAAAVLLLTLATAGMATAKSVYVIAAIINFDAPIPINVYDIGSDGLMTYQTQFGADFIGAGMVGITMDSDTGYLFSTYENSGFVLVTNAATLAKRTILSVPGATNLAGTVYDHQKKLLYCTECGRDKLYAVSWSSLTGTFAPVVGSPFTLEGAMIYGIALDEYNDLLYVASPSQGISVYSTSDWSLAWTKPAEAIAISIAVDPERDYLYYGGGYADNFKLTRRTISDWSKKEVQVDPEAGVIGLAVDPDTGLIYITTGRDNREGCGKDLMVYNSELEVLQMIPDIGRPTGLVIPAHDTSFNPLNLTK
ncbi:MAG: YncE family protein, partial [Solirubrobacterales bacterium]